MNTENIPNNTENKNTKNSEKLHCMILVSCFEKPKTKILKIEITKYHSFIFGIGQLPNQTDRISPLAPNIASPHTC